MGNGRPVVVGIDGSANSGRALSVALRAADRLDAELHVVHAVGLTAEIDGRHLPSVDHRDELSAAIEAWCAPLADAGVTFDTELVDGPPVDVLLRTAKRLDAELIVVGRRGAGGRPELLLGSTAHQVVEHAHVPVLVVPPIGHSATVGTTPA